MEWGLLRFVANLVKQSSQKYTSLYVSIEEEGIILKKFLRHEKTCVGFKQLLLKNSLSFLSTFVILFYTKIKIK